MSTTNLYGLRAARKGRVQVLPGDEYVHPTAALAKPQVAGRGDTRLGSVAYMFDVDERHGTLAEPVSAVSAPNLHHSTAVRYRVRSTSAASATSSAAGTAGSPASSGSTSRTASGSGSGVSATRASIRAASAGGTFRQVQRH